MTWQPIDESTPKDRPILLRGGFYGGHYQDDNPSFPDDLPASRWTAVVAIWYSGYSEGWWAVAFYDSGVASVGYDDPTEWMDIPD